MKDRNKAATRPGNFTYQGTNLRPQSERLFSPGATPRTMNVPAAAASGRLGLSVGVIKPSYNMTPRIAKNQALVTKSKVFTADGKSIETSVFALFQGMNGPAASAFIVFNNPDVADGKQSVQVQV